ncbi:hypothetical protein [Salinibacillus xinjiangensis]|uniref:hypothetical protein n=1 Tax=Salinibacillus xinjiangensis TaxID=1229268 RepID=UPI001890C86F|nr:hypothetical protein [Salinibacillus xinjiangensis]
MGIVLYLISLFILYILISSAVKTGINNSKLVELLEEKRGKEEATEPKKESFLDHDLDD